MNEQAKNSNGNGTAALAKLLNQLNLPTLAMILLVGGGNFVNTNQRSDEQRVEIEKTIAQIQDLHSAMQGFESRQRESLENQAQILRSQNISIQNQLEVLKKINSTEPKQ